MWTSAPEPGSGHPISRETLQNFQSVLNLLVPGCALVFVPAGAHTQEAPGPLPDHFPPDLIQRLHRLAGDDGPSIARETAVCLSEDGSICPVPISAAQTCLGETLVCFRTIPAAGAGESARPPAVLLYQTWNDGAGQLERMVLAARLGSGILAMDSRLENLSGIVGTAGAGSQPLASGGNSAMDLEELLRHIPEILLVCAPRGSISYVSPSVEAILGIPAAALVGTNWVDMQHPEDRASMAIQLSRGGAHDAIVHHRLQRADGKWRNFESRVLAGGTTGTLPPMAGATNAVLLAAQDITERLMLGQVLRDATTEAIAQRAAAERARLDAERANAAKNEFLSRMSHELRTPLNAVLGFAQLLERARLAANHHQMVEYILTAGRHLLNLINEILDISRIEAGQLELKIEPVDALKTARSVMELMQPNAENTGVYLVLEEEAGRNPPPALVDQQRLNQILLNLISNAIKYNRPGGRVRIKTNSSAGPEKEPPSPPHSVAAQTQLPPTKFRTPPASQPAQDPTPQFDGGFVEIQVEDNGPGIAPELLDRIFVPFDRLGAERRGIEGTGVGLALAKSLAEAMGGTLTVTSELGHGTCFSLRLPRAPQARQMVSQPGQKTARLEGVPPVSTQWIVLCLESDAANLHLIHRVLALRPEIRIMTASLWEAGLELAQRHRPDAILLDWHLSGDDGRGLIRELKALEETRTIPIVVVSAAAHPGDRKAALHAGADHFIAKPYEIEELLQALDVVLPLVPAEPPPAPVVPTAGGTGDGGNARAVSPAPLQRNTRPVSGTPD